MEGIESGYSTRFAKPAYGKTYFGFDAQSFRLENEMNDEEHYDLMSKFDWVTPQHPADQFNYDVQHILLSFGTGYWVEPVVGDDTLICVVNGLDYREIFNEKELLAAIKYLDSSLDIVAFLETGKLAL